MKLLLRGGRVLDPAQRRDGVFDVLISNGRIAKVEKSLRAARARVLDARGAWVLPGLVDAHVHLREPGGEESETIESGSNAAARGGVTSVLAMANTRPVTDNPQQVRFVVRRAREKARVRVYPVGAVTQKLEGKELTDIPAMARAGCRAFSDDGRCVMDARLLRRALEHTRSEGVPLIEHCEDENLSLRGVMNEGTHSVKLGLRGIPAESEAVIVARDLYLARLTEAPLHCAHVSTRDAVELLRAAKKKGIPVTAETCPHYFALTEEAVARYDSHAKMKPPLRTAADAEAVREGLADGTLDLIATDHAPHEMHSKDREFSQAPFGVIGLETALSLAYEHLILKGVLSPLECVRALSTNPARIFKLPAGSLAVGAAADLAVFDPRKDWRYDHSFSKSRNSPFWGRALRGQVRLTCVGGRVVYEDGVLK